MKQNHAIDKTVNLFKLFSDATRLKIIAMLVEGEYCVHEIHETLNISQSSVSHQLALLRERNVVKTRRDGKLVYYSLQDQHVKELFETAYAHANEC